MTPTMTERNEQTEIGTVGEIQGAMGSPYPSGALLSPSVPETIPPRYQTIREQWASLLKEDGAPPHEQEMSEQLLTVFEKVIEVRMNYELEHLVAEREELRNLNQELTEAVTGYALDQIFDDVTAGLSLLQKEKLRDFAADIAIDEDNPLPDFQAKVEKLRDQLCPKPSPSLAQNHDPFGPDDFDCTDVEVVNPAMQKISRLLQPKPTERLNPTLTDHIKRSHGFHSVLRKALSQPQLTDALPNADEVRTITEILNPIAEPYEAMLIEGILEPVIIRSYVLEHIRAIESSGAHFKVKRSAVKALERFMNEKLGAFALHESRFKHNRLPRTLIVHDERSGLFAGHVNGRRFKPLTDEQLHSHLTTTHKLHPMQAQDVIKQAKHSGTYINNTIAKSIDHSHQALNSIRQASKEPNQLRRNSHLKIANGHLQKSLEHAAKEKDQAHTPHLRSALKGIRDELDSFHHRSAVEKFKARFGARPEGEATPKDYLHVSGHDSDWILSPHDAKLGKRRIVWHLSKSERLK